MISAISTYMPRWLMAIIATALVLATVVGSSQDSAEAIDPADTDTVYIADGTNFADALMGATIAALNTSPMLGVAGTNSGDTIPGDTVDELDRLTNDKNDLLDTIFIFGGTAAVSANVETQLGQWANNVQRIEGDSRWGTYQAISELLPSAIDEAIHAQEADNADTLDGKDSGDFALSDQSCSAGQVVTGIAPDGTPTCAQDQVDGGDADTLDGMDSGDFALSDQACASGDVVTGVAADGTVTCAADNVDGGDAETLDGLDSPEFQRSGCVNGNVLAHGFVDESSLNDGSFGTAGVRRDFSCTGVDVTGRDFGTGEVRLDVGDSARFVFGFGFTCAGQVVQVTLDDGTGTGEVTVDEVLVDTGGVVPECHIVVKTFDSTGAAAEKDFHFVVTNFA